MSKNTTTPLGCVCPTPGSSETVIPDCIAMSRSCFSGMDLRSTRREWVFPSLGNRIGPRIARPGTAWMLSMSFWKVALSVAVLSDCRVMEKSALSASGPSFVATVGIFVGIDVDADADADADVDAATAADALEAPGVNETCPWETVEFIIVKLVCLLCYCLFLVLRWFSCRRSCLMDVQYISKWH
ncbi:MAG: hypothetical protein BYD32DRAFT_188735 [Podila humilis]|nr:MAG: hypothetical protein BYD32DRAFT_188735 [Podila humilis]